MVKAMTGVGPTTSEVFTGKDDDVARAMTDTRAAVRRTRLELVVEEVPVPAEAGIAATWWGWFSRFLGFEVTILPSYFRIHQNTKKKEMCMWSQGHPSVSKELAKVEDLYLGLTPMSDVCDDRLRRLPGGRRAGVWTTQPKLIGGNRAA